MLPHDELYHYGKKGMKWGKKKKNKNPNSEEELIKQGFTSTEVRLMQLRSWNNLPGELQKKINLKGVAINNVKSAVKDSRPKLTKSTVIRAESKEARAKVDRYNRAVAYDRNRQNIKNKKAYQNPPGKTIDIKAISAPMTKVNRSRGQKLYSSILRKLGFN
jgi:hypothetical protein